MMFVVYMMRRISAGYAKKVLGMSQFSSQALYAGGMEGYHRSAECKYDKAFKEEAAKLSDEIGVKQAAAQLDIPYYSLAEWRQKRKAFGDHAFVGSGIRRDAPLSENERRLIKENAELRRANEILKDALGFFAKDRKR